MSKKNLTLAMALVFSTHAVMAVVPDQALTFKTNISIFNADTVMTEKIRTAESLIKRVVASDKFRDQVLNHTFNGVKTFVDNGGFTNEQIYQKILDGAERLNGIKNNTMDMEMEMYYEYTSTVGYTYSGSPRIYANERFYNNYSPASMTSNMIHEWLHKLGFTHTSYYTSSRDSSVPYAIGYIMRTIAASLPAEPEPTPEPTPEYLTAATNVGITNTATTLQIKWGPASSSSGIAEYKIYRQLSGSTTNYLQGTTTALTFSQSLPTTNATYYVKAIDRAGKSINSTTVSFVKLTAVTNLSLTKTTSDVVLKWSAANSSSGVKEYKVYRRLNGSSINYLQGTTTNLTFTQAKPSATSAYYYVRSFDVNGVSKKSLEVMYTR